MLINGSFSVDELSISRHFSENASQKLLFGAFSKRKDAIVPVVSVYHAYNSSKNEFKKKSMLEWLVLT